MTPGPAVDALEAIGRKYFIASYFLGAIFAIIYTLIPDDNYYIYVFVKKYLWVIGCAIWAVESYSNCIPDASDWTYIYAYIVALTIPALLFTISIFFGLQNNSILSNIIVIFPTFTTLLIFFVDCCRRPVAAIVNAHKDLDESRLYVDLFSSCGPKANENLPLGQSDQKVTENTSTNPMICSLNDSTLTSIESSTATLSVDNKSLLLHLFKYSPRFYYRTVQSPHFKPAKMVAGSGRIRQYFLALAYMALFYTQFWFLFFFATNFRSFSQSNNGMSPKAFLISSAFFIVFVGVNFAYRFSLKRIGLALDKYKLNGISLFFMGELIGMMYFYTFYRLLFESVQSWAVFMAFQVIHMAIEWLSYPFRGSQWFYNLNAKNLTNNKRLRQDGDSLLNALELADNTKEVASGDHKSSDLPNKTVLKPCNDVSESISGDQNNLNITANHSSLLDVLVIALPDVVMSETFSCRDWQVFLSLDFAIRVACFTSSSLEFVIVFTILQKVPWVKTYLHSVNFSLTLAFVLVSVTFELANAFVINLYFFKPLNLPCFKELAKCFSDFRFAFFAFSVVFCCFVNPVNSFAKAVQY